ncbi:hypothetical protein ABN028_17330 [Actinopolymorpha sp. B17G11]|uniref:hypothetical protein n=1 Tax=Actinopolymorpha sp. B17G11 TaxID=3160861 RepID=UPI0032E51F6A
MTATNVSTQSARSTQSGPSIGLVTAVFLTTLIHHVYGGISYASVERIVLAVVFSVAYVLTVGLFLAGRTRRWARWLYQGLVLVFWIVLIGVYEGGYNHTLYVALRLIGTDPHDLEQIYPGGGDLVVPNDVFFQGTGILTLATALWVAFAWARRKSVAS